MNENVDGFRAVHAAFTPVPRSELVVCPATKGSLTRTHPHSRLHASLSLLLTTKADVCRYSLRARKLESRVNTWINEKMLFLEHYHAENLLWDAKNPYHKDKNKTHDVWTRIPTEMGIEIKELKKKKDSLLSNKAMAAAASSSISRRE